MSEKKEKRKGGEGRRGVVKGGQGRERKEGQRETEIDFSLALKLGHL